MRLTSRVSIPLVALALLAPRGHAQGTLVGVVREDSTGRPVAGAEVGIEAVKRRTTSDSSGHYVLARVPAGLHQVRVRQIGYYASSTMIRLIGGETRESDLVVNRVQQNLDPVVVTAVSRPTTNVGFAGFAGFAERRRLGAGKFIDSTELRRNEHRRTSDLIASLPGVTVVPQWICEPDNQLPRARRGVQTCRPDVYRGVAMNNHVDGMRRYCPMRVILDDMVVYAGMDARNQLMDWEGTFDINSVPISSLAGIEVYRNRSEMPMAYGGAGDDCGVLVLWTRH